MNLKHATLFIILSLFSYQKLKADNYLEGYIIKVNNDTLKGWIDYQNWQKSPNKVNFKQDISEVKFEEYRPYQIKGFYVKQPNEFYFSFIGDVNSFINKVEKFTSNPQMTLRKDTTFMLLLVKGKADLYSYNDAKDQLHLFISKEYPEIEELINYSYRTKKDKVRPIKKYLNQLSLYFKDCPAIVEQLNNLKYNENEMIDIFNRYNACISGENSTYQKNKENWKLKFGVVGGVSLTNVDFSGNATSFNFQEVIKSDFKNSFDYVFGANLFFLIPRNRQKWEINFSILFKSYKVIGNNDTDAENYLLEASHLRLHLMPKYYLSTNKIRPFIALGPSVSYLLQKSNFDKSRNSLIFERYKNLEFGLVGSVGMEYKSVGLDLRHEISIGNSNVGGLQESVNSSYFMLYYRFN